VAGASERHRLKAEAWRRKAPEVCSGAFLFEESKHFFFKKEAKNVYKKRLLPTTLLSDTSKQPASEFD
jgi:hypothetical protein